MPSLGADMDSGVLLAWRVAPGDTVHRGDIVAVVDTDKATIDVEVFEDGVVADLIVEPGREVPVGTVLAHIDPAGTAADAPAGPLPQAAPVVPTSEATGAASPARGSPPRHAVAASMTRSAREVPQYHLATTVDMGRAMAWLADANAARPPPERLLPAALLAKATARAAAEVPALNGWWQHGGFLGAAAVHLGVAVSLRGGGLVAPAIHDADGLALGELMAALRDLVARARTGRLRAGELTGATITMTSLGDKGVDEVHGLVHPPQVALVGFGRIAERPWAHDGMLGVRPTVCATLAGDHRASDGLVGARLLRVVDRLLQVPEDL